MPILNTKEIVGTPSKVRGIKLSLIVITILLLSAFVPLHLSSSTGTAQATTCPSTIRYGSSGTWVKRLQGSLNTRAVSNYLEVDGSFGPKTQTSVKQFQRAYKLTVDGIVGPQTWSALGFCGWSGHSGVSGGGCKTYSDATTCISVSSAGYIEPDVYLRKYTNLTVIVQLIKDGSIVEDVWWQGGPYSSGTYLYATPIKSSPGHIWQTRVIQNVVDFFADVPGMHSYSWSPIQYT
jgi:hypothetical protein